MSEHSSRLIHDIVATADLFLRESARLFRPRGLTAPQFNVLNLLAVHEGGAGMSQRELADLLVVDRSNVTGLLDRMESAGWVQRTDDPRDRRVYRVSLTAAGRRLWAQVAPDYEEVVRQVTAGVTVPRQGDMLACLALMREGALSWTLPGKAGAKTKKTARAKR